MKQCNSYCVAIQQSLDLTGFPIYLWLNSITIGSINEATKPSPFELSCGFQLATHADILLPITSALAPVVERKTELASVRDVVRELLTLSKQRMAACSLKSAPPSLWVILFSFPLKDYIFIHIV